MILAPCVIFPLIFAEYNNNYLCLLFILFMVDVPYVVGCSLSCYVQFSIKK